MPHKQKRGATAATDYNLPPTAIARPLPTSKPSGTKTGKPGQAGKDQQGAGKKRKRAKPSDDDTPKAFARLMAFTRGVKPKSGLDDGTRPSSSKKRKTSTRANDQTAEAEVADVVPREASKFDIPTIMPGERMADFSARVDAAMPLGKISSRGKGNVEGVKRYRTKLEKKITRMQDEWRERDKRMKDKVAEAEEEAEIEAILNGDDNAQAVRILEDPDKAETSKRKKKGKKGKKRKQGGADDSDDDPWAAVAKARKAVETESTGLIGVHDVVQAPPKFDVKVRERFKVRNGVGADVADVPGAAGSLRRREELGRARQDVLEKYRSTRKGTRV